MPAVEDSDSNASNPLISIIIPAYNAAKYLPDAIRSALDQTYQHIEIIVVDDGSTDNTRQVVEASRANLRIRFIQQPNLGLASARNTGIRAAQGTLIHLLDADDVLLSACLEKAVPLFSRGAELVFSAHEIRNEDLTTSLALHTPVFAYPYDYQQPINSILNYSLNHLTGPFVPSAVTFRRALWEAVGGFDERLRACEDWHFWFRLTLQGIQFQPLLETLIWYRQTPGSLSSQKLLMAQESLKAIQLVTELSLPSEIDLKHAIANRHHILAIEYWRSRQANLARIEFHKAIQLTSDGKLARRLLILITHLVTAPTGEAILKRLDQIRQSLQRSANPVGL